MGKKNITSDGVIGPWSVRDGKGTIYLAGTFDGATCQVKFKAPWGDVWIPDARFQYSGPTVDLIEVGEQAVIKLSFSGSGGALNVDAEVTT